MTKFHEINWDLVFMVDINDIYDDINDQISFDESMITKFDKAL